VRVALLPPEPLGERDELPLPELLGGRDVLLLPELLCGREGLLLPEPDCGRGAFDDTGLGEVTVVGLALTTASLLEAVGFFCSVSAAGFSFGV
jgi:hypothetical protein